MRELSAEELEYACGGYDPNEDIVVVGNPYYPPWFPYYPDSPYFPPSSPSYPSYPYGGSPAPAPLHTTTTASGVKITYDGNLTQAQVDVMTAIADYGKTHGYSNGQIWNAIQQAYHESKLGADWGGTDQTADGVHYGLFQYDTTSFARWNPTGSVLSNADQIAAIYKEYDTFTLSRWTDGVASGAIPATLTYDEYLEYKHHQPGGDGGVTNGAPWTAYQATYDRDSYTGPEAIKLRGVNQ